MDKAEELLIEKRKKNKRKNYKFRNKNGSTSR